MSLAKVMGLQEIYIILGVLIFSKVLIVLLSNPLLGGSTIIASYSLLLFRISPKKYKYHKRKCR